MPLLERDAQLDVLHEEEGSARAGHGRVVVVSGEAGGGKSALVRAAFPAALRGYCEPLATPRPLGPFRDLAGRLFPDRALPPDPIAVGDLLLSAMARPGPALVIEDAHWIDSASCDVVRFLGRRIGETCGLLVVVVRSGAAAGGAVSAVLGDLASADVLTRCAVAPLSRDAVARLSGGTGEDVDAALRLTGGNAFLVTQLLRSAEGGATLAEVVAARIAPLSPEARTLLERLAVVPGRAPAEVVGDDWQHLAELDRADLLTVSDEAVELRHELLRLAVLEGLPQARRRALHEEVLARLRSAPAPEPAAVAHHARLARHGAVAMDAEMAAARRAAAFGSHHEAVEHYRRALEDAVAGASAADRVRLLLLLVAQESAVGDDAAALEAADEALALSATLDDGRLRSDAVRMRSRIEQLEARANELALLAVELTAPHPDSREYAAAVANLASARMVARDLTAAVRKARAGIAAARAVGDVESEIIASNSLGSALLLQGHAAGEAPLRRAIHLGAAHGFTAEVGRAYANLVSASGEARQYALSAAAALEAARYFAARDLDGHAWYTRAWSARCLFEQGRWREAGDELDRLRAAGDRANTITRVMVAYLTARIRARSGEGDPGPELDRAERIAEGTGALQRLAPAVAARAEADWLAGRPLPVERLRDLHDIAVARGDRWASGELALWLRRAGEPSAAPEPAAPPFRLQLAGDHRAAADAWAALGCPYETADALSDSVDEQDLRRALAIAADLGALPLWRRIAARLRASGARSVPRAPGPGRTLRPDGLTAREGEVLVWLEKGAPDSEIAGHLTLSVRTVEHHVAEILRKKQVASRRELDRRR